MSPHYQYKNISSSNIHHAIIKSAPVLTKTTKMFFSTKDIKSIRLQIHTPTPAYLQLDITWYYLMSQHEVKNNKLLDNSAFQRWEKVELL